MEDSGEELILHVERSCCCSRGEKIDTFSYAFEGEMIALLHNKSGFPEGVSSYANVQRQFFESFVGQTFKVAYPPINFLLFFSVADPGCLSRIRIFSSATQNFCISWKNLRVKLDAIPVLV